MWQKLLQESSFFLLLLEFDRDLAEEFRGKGCGVCGGRLDRSAYRRKPRGGSDELGEDYAVRESFCCSEEGCRRRLTPPSLRFLGRRVYLGAVVVLVSAMVQGVTAKRARSMHELCGVSVRTLHRWRKRSRYLFEKPSYCPLESSPVEGFIVLSRCHEPYIRDRPHHGSATQTTRATLLCKAHGATRQSPRPATTM